MGMIKRLKEPKMQCKIGILDTQLTYTRYPHIYGPKILKQASFDAVNRNCIWCAST